MDRKVEAQQGKKSYQAPQLRMYGSLTELTNSTMTPTPGNDSQGKGNSGS